MEQADPPNVTPALDIIQSIYKCIGRKERREQNLADTWSAFETNVFLGSFFYWWTDDGGASIVTALVTDGGTALAKHEEPAQQFGQHRRVVWSQQSQPAEGMGIATQLIEREDLRILNAG